MNKSPLNYLITIAFGALLWLVTAIFYGGNFTESLMLAVSTPEEFLGTLRKLLGIGVGVGIINCLYWYFYGGLSTTAGDLGKARRVWWVSFILQIVASAAILFALVFINIKEGISTSAWLIIFGLLSLQTWFFFWLCTFFMSPRTVKNIPLFR